jgi:hypothetical protein
MFKTKAIELLGGSIATAAEAVGVSYQAVSQWPHELPERISDRVLAALARKHLPPGLIGTPDTDTPKRAKDVPAAGAGQLRPVKPAGLKNTKVQALEAEAQHD